MSKARYFGPKLAGFCGSKRVGPKNRIKSRFLACPKPKKYGRAGLGQACGPEISAQNPTQKRAEPNQNDHIYKYLDTQLFYHTRFILSLPQSKLPATLFSLSSHFFDFLILWSFLLQVTFLLRQETSPHHQIHKSLVRHCCCVPSLCYVPLPCFLCFDLLVNFFSSSSNFHYIKDHVFMIYFNTNHDY